LPRDSISVIFNPVVTPELIEKSRVPLQHPGLGEGKPPVILGVGRLTPQKDFSTLIRAFARVRTVRDCRLVIVGEGELRAEREPLVRSLGRACGVRWPGCAEDPSAWRSRVGLSVRSRSGAGWRTVRLRAMAWAAAAAGPDSPRGRDEVLQGGKWAELVPAP